MEVRAEQLTMEYLDAGAPVRVFSDLTFAVAPKSSVAIVGRSGVGKTTLLNLLAGLEHPMAGKVHIGGTCITDLMTAGSEMAHFRGQNIGYVFQSHHLFPEFDAVENVAMPLLFQGVAKREAMERAAGILQLVSLGHRLHHRPGALSGGEQQRVAIARAISGNPGVLLADEPTGNLDQETGSQIVGLLVELQKARGMTLLMVTHSHEIALMMDRVVELTAHGIVERRADEMRAKR